ncbi:Ubiquitin carboxyl-terminal hydrolase 12 [Sesbania bispinosa]|nr:Ubiquitin carboxyl-terminal hydrolase 12 [Sesbania bispinosa]
MEGVQDSLTLERVEDSMDGIGESENLEIVEDSLEGVQASPYLERVEDSFDSVLIKDDEDHSINSTLFVEKRAPLDIDLNVSVNRGFDLNQIPEDEDEALGKDDEIRETVSDEALDKDDEIRETVSVMLKIYLPTF